MKKQLSALAICLAVTLTACGPKSLEAEPTHTPLVTPAASDPAPTSSTGPEGVSPSPSQAPQQRPAPVWEGKTVKVNPKTEDGVALLAYTMTVPEIQNAVGIAAYEAINSYYERAILEFQLAAGEQRDWAQDDYTASQSSGFPFAAYVEEYTYTITRQTDRFVSVCRELYANEGAAYPSTYRLSEQFDLATGKQMTFSDFFFDPVGAAAQAKLELAALNAASADPLDEDAFLSAFHQERFYLTEEGFCFYFQGEDLGALHSPVEYTVPYEKLEDWTVEWIKN